jgi:REP element-mobilizing transposase RayT
MRQQSLFANHKFSPVLLGKKEFGGELLKGKRKSERPLSIKSPIHLIMRGRSARSFLCDANEITRIINQVAFDCGVKIYDSTINSNHIHLVIKLKCRSSYKKLIRIIAGILALKFKIKWLLRPYTRIANWGRDFKALRDYLFQNHREALGVMEYRPRKPMPAPRT